MDDAGNTREQLMAANAALRQYVATLEAVRTEHVQTEQARKQAQEALEQRVMPRTAALLESEAQYRQLLDESLQGILIHRDDRALFVNQAYADILGYATPDEIYRLDTLNTLIAPHERERLTGYRDTRLAEEPAPSFYEYQGVRKDGSLLWLDMTVRVVSWKGRPATQSIITDITARKRTEAALHDSRQFLQSTLDALSAHIAILDETGTIISVNAAWQQFAQGQGLRDPSHAVGTNYLAICDRVTGSDATDASAMAQGIREVVARQRAFFALEYACHSPDEQRWFVARVTCFERQRASRIVVAHETITERKRSEEALRQSEARYRTLVDTIPHGIQENDVSGTITFSNRAHARLLGYADGELLGKAIWDV
ncbi:MAG: PAS domain S-box protein, partial [Candidatus Tectomicrobia bacterium]|nr:PAS domain S-box protein [Candidatus Tectomicrobia bacterium]